MQQKKAIIIGAGPAGLTAAYELLDKTDIQPVVYEMSNQIGGISRTVNYKGYRMDIGGHRFFSKSDVVMNWWLKFLPLQASPEQQVTIAYHNSTRQIQNTEEPADPNQSDQVMLVRNRKSRIFFLRQFFDYPISLSKKTILGLGLLRTLKIILSYLYIRIFPIKKEKNLEQFFTNRFGKVLYQIFFKSYTEKVWGVPCSKISAEWGAQRIKGLSISKTIQHIIKSIFKLNSQSITQKNVETSLIERFLYPKHGPGQLWEEVVRQIQARGGEVYLNTNVQSLFLDNGNIAAVEIYHAEAQATERVEGDYFISTMPIKELINKLQTDVSPEIKEISEGLIYRDFITVGLLLEKLSVKDQEGEKLIKDNWIYVQEPDVQLGRIQVFNNWSPYLVKDPTKVWLGLEYFCYEADQFWQMSNAEIAKFAIRELIKIKFINSSEEVLDYTVIKVPKTYPAYFGTYPQFDRLKSYINQFENLYLVGRNGMHKYNNQDHSMLTAMAAVENIKHGVTDKSNIWAINTEEEYHEENSSAANQTTTAESSQRQQARQILRQFKGYLFTGGTATIVDVLIFSILTRSGLWYVSALCVSAFMGLTTNFWLSRRYVFGIYWKNSLVQYAVFTTVALNSLLANLGLLHLLIDEVHWNATFARLTSAACVALLSFTGHKLYSFTSSSPALFESRDFKKS